MTRPDATPRHKIKQIAAIPKAPYITNSWPICCAVNPIHNATIIMMRAIIIPQIRDTIEGFFFRGKIDSILLLTPNAVLTYVLFEALCCHADIIFPLHHHLSQTGISIIHHWFEVVTHSP